MKNNNWDVFVIYAAILTAAVALMYMFINLMISTI
jgi:hypothetical protein